MFKKILIGGSVLLILAAVLMGPSALYHVKKAFSWARDEVAESVPVEYQLEQAEDMIQEIVPEIEESKRRVAEEQVEAEYLHEEIVGLETKQGRDAKHIKARNASLKSGRVDYVVAGRRYSRQAMAHQVRLALEKHRQNQALLENKCRLREARGRSLEAAQHKLDTFIGEKQNLEIAVQRLRAQLRETQALEATTCRFDLDDSKLADVKELLARVRKRLDVSRKLLESEAPTLIDLPEAGPSPADVTVEVDRYLGEYDSKNAVVMTLEGGVPVAVGGN